MNDTTRLVLLAVFVAVLLVMGWALWLIGSETLRTLAFILIGGLVLIGAIAASALPIRAARKRDMTGETRIVDGTKTIIRETRVIDGRQIAGPEIKLLQLPAQQQGAAFPELLRAGYQAGLLANQSPARTIPGQDLRALDFTDDGDGGGWSGDITG